MKVGHAKPLGALYGLGTAGKPNCTFRLLTAQPAKFAVLVALFAALVALLAADVAA